MFITVIMVIRKNIAISNPLAMVFNVVIGDTVGSNCGKNTGTHANRHPGDAAKNSISEGPGLGSDWGQSSRAETWLSERRKRRRLDRQVGCGQPATRERRWVLPMTITPVQVR